MTTLDLPTLPQLYRVSAYGPDSAEARRLSRGAATKTFTLLHPGVYARTADLADLKPEDRHRLRVRAAMPALGPHLVVARESAAIIHGLPALHRGPTRVQVVDQRSTRPQCSRRVVKYAGPLAEDEVTVADGLRVTTIDRTLVDVALHSRFAVAVTAIDRALGADLTTASDLEALLEAHPALRGRAAAERALAFARCESGSPGESWCRCRLFEMDAPEPILQQAFWDADGLIGYVDFWWPEFGVVLEFDGDIKYSDEDYRDGLTPEEVLRRQRRRESRLRAHPAVRAVIRVEWRDLVEPWRLRALLVKAGVIG